MKETIKRTALIIAFGQALVAMWGSLIFSEILHFTPCILCWYQRIAMYPLVPILLMGILKKDKNVYMYALPLSIIGWIIALYHNLLYYQLIPHSAEFCKFGVSCTEKYIEWFGFITIPLLSFVAFSVINICMIILIKSDFRKNHV